MKIALVCSHGGHLTEMKCLMEAFEDHDFFFISYDTPRTHNLAYPKYLLKGIGVSPYYFIVALIAMIKIFQKEKPGFIVSTGSEIAIPAFFLSKIFRIKTIYIESWCRVNSKSGTGMVLYYFSDIFLVQWEGLAKKYGRKAKFVVAVV
jgi:UDP-N-acetylglucosamine:LPS N-acetylglucosamine transferase